MSATIGIAAAAASDWEGVRFLPGFSRSLPGGIASQFGFSGIAKVTLFAVKRNSLIVGSFLGRWDGGDGVRVRARGVALKVFLADSDPVTPGDQVVFVVDHSRSIPEDQAALALEVINRARERMDPRLHLGKVVVFGREGL
ncbi:MAG: hypothetical protein GY888_15380, partial [Planctomycetaceae bacterium]|nr:hypothetical protein [Planctomycetaceae bacterium]